VNPIRVLLVDDHDLVRHALAALLRTFVGIEVVGEADSAELAIDLLLNLAADVVVMDVSMKGIGGIEGTLRIRRDHPDLQVVMLSMHDEEDYVQRALRAGASGYLLKGAAKGEFELALRAAARGETYLSPAISRQVVAGYVRQLPAERSPLALLTPRQRQILQAVAEGLSTKEIAFRLQVSTKTVETHRVQLMDRLDIHDVAGLVRFAVRHRLVSSDR